MSFLYVSLKLFFEIKSIKMSAIELTFFTLHFLLCISSYQRTIPWENFEFLSIEVTNLKTKLKLKFGPCL